MDTIYDSELKSINDDIRSYNGGVQLPATEYDIQSLKKNSKSELGIDVPDEYLIFLSKRNGLDYNGTVFYATDRKLIAGYDDRFIAGIISANLIARDVEEMTLYLIFGESDDLLHVLYLPEKRYYTIESIGHSLYASYDSLDHLIKQVLNEAL